MSRSYRKIIRNRKQRIERRLAPKNWEDQAQPMLKASNIHYEMAEKTEAISYGGIGAMHKMIGKLGLAGRDRPGTAPSEKTSALP